MRVLQRPRPVAGVAPLLVFLALLLAALLPRAFTLDAALTIDERLWIDRSARFADAVLDGRFADAFETGHPGVTIMWVGGLAQRTLPEEASLPERYARARLALALVDVALILVIWWLARALFGALAAATGSLLLALDPFLIAHNRVLQMDGLLTLLMLASFLALLRAVREEAPRLLTLSGALAGLAFLTKQPSAFLVPATLAVLWRDGRGIRRRFLRWLAPAVAVFAALWPAVWVRPWKPLAVMLGGAGAGVAEAHSGGFFLGRQVRNPGLLFYPVAFLWRSSIATLPATIATAVWCWRRRRSDGAARDAAALLAFGLGFLLMMSVALKKGDRYILPSFGAADLAVGIAAARLLSARPAAARAPALAALLALHAGPALALHPYEIAHYNWAVGGPRTARHVIVVGWGEGLDRAAAALNRLPGARDLTVATTRVTQFADFFEGRTVRIQRSGLLVPGAERPDLVLFYISSVQVGRYEEAWRRFRDRAPVYALDINGLPYVRVYPVAG